jgi:hypothetical protein
MIVWGILADAILKQNGCSIQGLPGPAPSLDQSLTPYLQFTLLRGPQQTAYRAEERISFVIVGLRPRAGPASAP